jgi:hypothetical protein
MIEFSNPVRLRLLAGVTLLISALADVYAVRHHLPYQLGGHGSPAEVGRDWSGHGTALGPPLMPMLVLLVLLPLVGRRPSRLGAAAECAGVLVAFALVFGTIGEPSFRTVFTPSGFDAAQAAIRLALLVTALLLAGYCGVGLVRRRQVS